MTDRLTCDDCGSVVELRKGYAGALEVTCACGHKCGVKVSSVLPKEWSACETVETVPSQHE